jgi:hypothetical protein
MRGKENEVQEEYLPGKKTIKVAIILLLDRGFAIDATRRNLIPMSLLRQSTPCNDIGSETLRVGGATDRFAIISRQSKGLYEWNHRELQDKFQTISSTCYA